MFRKTLKICVVGLLIFVINSASCYPWTNNTREHLFGTVTQCDRDDCDEVGHIHVDADGHRHNVGALIKDEGFR
jgi:hypothetical protein